MQNKKMKMFAVLLGGSLLAMSSAVIADGGGNLPYQPQFTSSMVLADGGGNLPYQPQFTSSMVLADGGGNLPYQPQMKSA